MSKVTGSERPLRVVIVEDSDSDADMLRRLIVTKFEVLRARTMGELLELARHQDPDVILLDLRLPDGGDYISLVMKVCTRFRSSATIVITGMEDETLALETLRAGAQDYLVKEMYVRDQMVKKIFHAHARKAATLRAAEASVATAAAASNSSMHIAAVDPDLLTKKLEAMVTDILEKQVLAKHHLRPRTDVHETVPPTNFGAWLDLVGRALKGDWKFLSGLIVAIIVYVTDFRDTVLQTADAVRENADAVEKTAKATKEFEKKQKETNKEFEESLVKSLVITIRATEHLEKMIQTSAPKTQFPSPPKELKAAQDAVKRIEATELLFDKPLDDDEGESGDAAPP